MTPEAIKQYLDDCIKLWREKKENGDETAVYYIDAFQSVRMSIFGEILS